MTDLATRARPRDTAARADLEHWAGHREVIATAESFVAATIGQYLWDAAATEPGARLVGGKCGTCGSDLAIQLPADHELVVELEGADVR
jgi:hypothetical protein